jgi:hypothetical protein
VAALRVVSSVSGTLSVALRRSARAVSAVGEGDLEVPSVECHEEIPGLDVLVVVDEHLGHVTRDSGADRRDPSHHVRIVRRDVGLEVAPPGMAVDRAGDDGDAGQRQEDDPLRRPREAAAPRKRVELGVDAHGEASVRGPRGRTP